MRLSCGPLLCFGEAGPRAAATPLSLQRAVFHALVQLDVPFMNQLIFRSFEASSTLAATVHCGKTDF